MAYVAEALANRCVKDPVKFYIYTVAKEGYEPAGQEFSEAVTRKLMRSGRAYLATLSAFADSRGITYAGAKQSKEEEAHERWHIYLQNNNLVSNAGDFIEEAGAAVIESVIGGFTGECLEPGRRFLKLHKRVQKASGRGLERLLEKKFAGRREMIYEAGKQIMEGSCPWLSYISQAQYFLLYGLCFSVYEENGLARARRIYKESLKKAKYNGVDAGLNCLRQHASSSVAGRYDFDLSDIGGYFPDAPYEKEYSFFSGKLKIEAYYTYRTWLVPLETEIRKRGFK